GGAEVYAARAVAGRERRLSGGARPALDDHGVDDHAAAGAHGDAAVDGERAGGRRDEQRDDRAGVGGALQSDHRDVGGDGEHDRGADAPHGDAARHGVERDDQREGAGGGRAQRVDQREHGAALHAVGGDVDGGGEPPGRPARADGDAAGEREGAGGGRAERDDGAQHGGALRPELGDGDLDGDREHAAGGEASHGHAAQRAVERDAEQQGAGGGRRLGDRQRFERAALRRDGDLEQPDGAFGHARGAHGDGAGQRQRADRRGEERFDGPEHDAAFQCRVGVGELGVGGDHDRGSAAARGDAAAVGVGGERTGAAGRREQRLEHARLDGAVERDDHLDGDHRAAGGGAGRDGDAAPEQHGPRRGRRERVDHGGDGGSLRRLVLALVHLEQPVRHGVLRERGLL